MRMNRRYYLKLLPLKKYIVGKKELYVKINRKKKQKDTKRKKVPRGKHLCHSW